MQLNRRIRVIDSHTGGEPTRLVLDGFPDLGRGSMAERRAVLAAEHDRWRAAAVLEPRGNDVLVGALLCEPVDPSAAAGVIFFNNVGMLGMCGHGTIGVVVSLAHLGRIGPGRHTIETPVGTVQTTLHDDGSVSVRNVPSYRLAKAVAVEVPGIGTVHGDIAWGGNWFFLVDVQGLPGLRIAGDNLAALSAYGQAVQRALLEQGVRAAEGAVIDHVELFAEAEPGAPAGEADARNFVLCPGGAWDRSPCGTGTSAKLACLAAEGHLAPGRLWRQMSVIGSLFEAHYEAHYEAHDEAHDEAADGHDSLVLTIVPTVRGRAHVMAEATLIVSRDDPFAWGIRF